MSKVDWEWKIREAVERVKTRYDHIGRKTGAPFLALVYPMEVERDFLKECRTQLNTLGNEFVIKYINVLKITMSVVEELGSENIIHAIANPMPGSNPESELGSMWVNNVVSAIKGCAKKKGTEKVVIVLEYLAALYPVSGPRAIMQALWDCEQSSIDGPVVVLIPGTLQEPRVYSFLNQRKEFMYRGDIL